jgi:uncharacterized GH25 family protein
VAIASLATAPLSAHDFWLAAANWTPAAGAPVTIHAGLGERFPTQTGFKPRPDWFDHWRVIGASGDITVSTAFQLTDLTMTTEVRLPSAGAYLGVMRVTPRIENMKGLEFTDYLKEEGLDTIIAARQTAGDSDKPARELYARYAKIALRNGDGSGAHLTRPVGLKAEFVPTTDPTALHPGGSLTVQLLADGAPVAGSEVTAVTDGSSVKGQTDGNGRVTLKIDREGAWLIRTVHMVPLTGSPAADWESYWVTLSFHTARP